MGGVACLAEDGTIVLVEPFAKDRVEENFNTAGDLYCSPSITLAAPQGDLIRLSSIAADQLRTLMPVVVFMA